MCQCFVIRIKIQFLRNLALLIMLSVPWIFILCICFHISAWISYHFSRDILSGSFSNTICIWTIPRRFNYFFINIIIVFYIYLSGIIVWFLLTFVFQILRKYHSLRPDTELINFTCMSNISWILVAGRKFSIDSLCSYMM